MSRFAITITRESRRVDLDILLELLLIIQVLFDGLNPAHVTF